MEQVIATDDPSFELIELKGRGIMKHTAAIVIGLLVFIGIVLSTCEKRQTDVYAVVNGLSIHGSDFLNEGNNKTEESKKSALDAYIQQKVIDMEVERLQTTQKELFSFFDSLKTRNIPANKVEEIFKKEFKDQSVGAESKADMLNAVRTKQFDLAQKTYIHELMTRSTILTVDDDGIFHTYKPEENQLN